MQKDCATNYEDHSSVVMCSGQVLLIQIGEQQRAGRSLCLHAIQDYGIPLFRLSRLGLVRSKLRKVNGRNEGFFLHIMHVDCTHTNISSTRVNDRGQVIVNRHRKDGRVFFGQGRFGTTHLQGVAMSVPTVPVDHVRVSASIRAIPLRRERHEVRVTHSDLRFLYDRVRGRYLNVGIVNCKVFATVLTGTSRDEQATHRRGLLPIQEMEDASRVDVPNSRHVYLRNNRVGLRGEERKRETSDSIQLKDTTRRFLTVQKGVVRVSIIAAMNRTLKGSHHRVMFRRVVTIAEVKSAIIQVRRAFRQTARLFTLIHRRVSGVIFYEEPTRVSFKGVLRRRFLARHNKVRRGRIVLLLTRGHVVRLITIKRPIRLFVNVKRCRPTNLCLNRLAANPKALRIMVIQVTNRRVLTIKQGEGPTHSKTRVNIRRERASLRIQYRPTNCVNGILFLFGFTFRRQLRLIIHT